MPIEAPGPVIEVINPTVMSAAAAGKAITEVTITTAAKRTEWSTRTSQIGGEKPTTMHVRRRRPHVNFKLETISSQWFSCPSLRMAEQKCRCGPGFFAPQNTDDSPAVTVAAAPGRRAWHDARYRSYPRYRRHRHRIDLRSRRARPRSDFLGYARGFRAVRRHCRVFSADACLAAARPHARHGLSGRDLGGGRLHCRHCASLAPPASRIGSGAG